MKGAVHEEECTRRRRYMTGTVLMKETIKQGDGKSRGLCMKRQYMKGTVQERDAK